MPAPMQPMDCLAEALGRLAPAACIPSCHQISAASCIEASQQDADRTQKIYGRALSRHVEQLTASGQFVVCMDQYASDCRQVSMIINPIRARTLSLRRQQSSCQMASPHLSDLLGAEAGGRAQELPGTPQHERLGGAGGQRGGCGAAQVLAR